MIYLSKSEVRLFVSNFVGHYVFCAVYCWLGQAAVTRVRLINVLRKTNQMINASFDVSRCEIS